MLFLIGGVSRAGKTILASRLLARHKVPWFSIDALRMGLHEGAPSLGLDPANHDLADIDRLWPIIRGMSNNLLYQGPDYCIEGALMRPDQAAELMACQPGRVRACFLGYPGMETAAKFERVRQHAGGANDWLSHRPFEEIEAFLLQQVQLSAILQASACAVGIPFFDTGEDFMAGLDAAERSLTDGWCETQNLLSNIHLG
jgi:hypothetical protein